MKLSAMLLTVTQFGKSLNRQKARQVYYCQLLFNKFWVCFSKMMKGKLVISIGFRWQSSNLTFSGIRFSFWFDSHDSRVWRWKLKTMQSLEFAIKVGLLSQPIQLSMILWRFYFWEEWDDLVSQAGRYWHKIVLPTFYLFNLASLVLFEFKNSSIDIWWDTQRPEQG